MQEKLTARLAELQKEYQKGQERLSLLEQEMNDLKSTLLRISGAIQVLEELQQEGPASLSENGSPASVISEK